MKIIIDTSVINQLTQTLGPDKAAQALFVGINEARAEVSLPGLDYSTAELYLTYEEVLRQNKIRQRKGVAEMEHARDCLNHLNKVAGKNFKMLDTNLKPIACLIREYGKEAVIRVIDNKVAKWTGTSMEDYLSPKTLFRPSNFEVYVNESLAPQVAEKNFANELDGILGGGK